MRREQSSIRQHQSIELVVCRINRQQSRLFFQEIWMCTVGNLYPRTCNFPINGGFQERSSAPSPRAQRRPARVGREPVAPRGGRSNPRSDSLPSGALGALRAPRASRTLHRRKAGLGAAVCVHTHPARRDEVRTYAPGPPALPRNANGRRSHRGGAGRFFVRTRTACRDRAGISSHGALKRPIRWARQTQPHRQS